MPMLFSQIAPSLQSSSSGGKTVPQIFFGDIHIGGCDDLINLDRIGKLEVEDE
jgi:glutaredoxin 3